MTVARKGGLNASSDVMAMSGRPERENDSLGHPRSRNRPSAVARTVPIPLQAKPAQLSLPIGFYLEPQCRTFHASIDAPMVPADAAPRVDLPELCVATPDGRQFSIVAGEYCPKCHSWLRNGQCPKCNQPPAPPKRTRAKSTRPEDPRWWATRAWQEANERAQTNGYCPIPSTCEFVIHGMEIENPLNNSQGFSKGAVFARNKANQERGLQALYWTKHHAKDRFLGWPVEVTLIRVAPDEFDGDGLQAAFKKVRDGVAQALGFLNDKERPGILNWKCRWEAGGRRRNGKSPAYHEVRIRIEAFNA